MPVLQTSYSQVKVIDSNTVQMNKESLRRMVIFLIERESLLETVKAKDLEIMNLEGQIELQEKEGNILKESLKMASEFQKPSWWNNFVTGIAAGTLIAILLQTGNR
ncbi:MAG TPA: hypothetical protein VHO43_14485 [Ignavibacteriales bacterium]|nr:hypothetical protein [Ignavibacteriales bacterium]